MSRVSRRSRVGRLILLLALALTSVLRPEIAQAHAAFMSSEPEPGAQLPSAPGVVVLRFSEPIIPNLSRAKITAPDGQGFEGTASGEREIQVPLSTDATGIYQVDWTTVSPVDGHTLHGTFRFGVLVDPGEGAEGDTSLAPDAFGLVIAIARAVEYSGLLLAVGMVLLQSLARRQPSLTWVGRRPHLPLAVALLAGCSVVLGEAFAALPTPSGGALLDYLTAGPAGAARVARLIAEALALLLAIFGLRLVLVPLTVAFVALAAAGHAAAVRPAWWGISVDAVHLIAAGLWAGGILALATLRPPEGWLGPAGRKLLDRFTPVALPAFVITVGYGIVRAFQELSSPTDLLTSSYGQVLSLKVVGVLAMALLSLLAWRRRFVGLRLEAAVAVFVIGAAALLASFPLPPGRLSEAEATQDRWAPSPALPEAGDLTLGGEAGELLVGLTLRPGEPGRNGVLVYLLPTKGRAAAAGIPVELALPGRSLEMQECGPTCRSADIELQGGERVEVRVGGAQGGTAVFDLPGLPAPDGSVLFQRMQERMHKLRTFRLDEVLGPAEPPTRATYAFQAPDRMRGELSTGRETIWVGQTRYSRDGPGASWRVEDARTSVQVPRYVWDIPGGQVVAPRLLGTASWEGLETRILSFFVQAGKTPIWFRLWVDSEGLVRRAEMRAQGHFMDHRYYDFDAPFTIEPPSS